MSNENTLTEAEMRERVEEIAIDAYVDTSNASEPLAELIQRVRAGLEDELENMSTLFQDFNAELDEFEAAIAATEARQPGQEFERS